MSCFTIVSELYCPTNCIQGIKYHSFIANFFNDIYHLIVRRECA